MLINALKSSCQESLVIVDLAEIGEVLTNIMNGFP